MDGNVFNQLGSKMIVNINEPDWKAMADSFSSLVMSAPDGLAMAKSMSERMAEFLEISMPVGGIFAAALLRGPDVSLCRAFK